MFLQKNNLEFLNELGNENNNNKLGNNKNRDKVGKKVNLKFKINQNS